MLILTSEHLLTKFSPFCSYLVKSYLSTSTNSTSSIKRYQSISAAFSLWYSYRTYTFHLNIDNYIGLFILFKCAGLIFQAGIQLTHIRKYSDGGCL